jgi:hypothetical protein
MRKKILMYRVLQSNAACAFAFDTIAGSGMVKAVRVGALLCKKRNKNSS